ncbi:hypothetical protein HNP55_004289 [Paucibacter oligotrophus]|uniref:TfoX N-terminal domain-containing protein n=1 Tax=Roseateles oligotrophus TaxID=1769250 RepID=A0A840LKC5_9BURK|nr:TfoX/Sxy family protein [Roseateles oligotrophus]MBB4845737.1 hypothetical protein [Roseateles oligotrophus]
MARDPGLEAILFEELGGLDGLTDKAMFGGWAWLLEGHLLCGARTDGMLVRLGKGQDGWALALPGVAAMISRGKPMAGWVRAEARAFANDQVRRQLLDAALRFVAALPRK